MKKDLHEILDTLTPEESDTLPEELFQSETLDDITLRRIQTAVAEKTGLMLDTKKDTANSYNKKKNTITSPVRKAARRTSGTLRRSLAAVACITIFLGAGAGACAYTVAKREYKSALTFFYENDLSTDGLTKNEIKEVYRDFYSHSFTNDLTTDVLLNSRPDVIRGFEITGDVSEWDTTVPDTSLSDYKTPVYYEYDVLYSPIKGTYNPQTHAYSESFDKSVFTKYCNGEKVWEVTFTDFAINGYYGDPESDDAPVLVYGTPPYTADVEDGIATLLALDADGTLLWKVTQNNTLGYDRIDKILSHPDGAYTAFGRCGYTGDTFDNALTVNKYDKDGAQIFSNIIAIRDHFIQNAALTSSGYLVNLSSYVTIEFSRVLNLDAEGNLLGDFRYESEENDFFISDLCEHNGTVYISGYSTPKAPEDYGSYLMRDLYGLVNKLHSYSYREKHPNDIYTKEELLSMFREQFTAVLLVCGPDAGTPQEFYSIAGSLGDQVYVSDGSVCWFTKDIIDCSYSPQKLNMVGDVGHVSSPAHYAALCRFCANSFNADGTFKEQKKLDLMTERHWPR